MTARPRSFSKGYHPPVSEERRFRRAIRWATYWAALAPGIPAVLLFILVLFLLKSAARVDQAHQVISAAHRVEKTLGGMDLSLRSSQLTPDATSLARSAAAGQELKVALQELTTRLAEDSAQSLEVAGLTRQIAAWQAHVQTVEGTARPTGDAAFQVTGMQLIENVRSRIARIIAAAEEVRNHRAGTLQKLRVALFSSLALLAVIAAPAAVLGVRKILRRVTGAYHRNLQAAQQRATELHVTLRSIGDAVVATDAAGGIVFLNPIAEQLTGWENAEAQGRLVGEVFRIHHETTGEPVEDPVARVLRERTIISLANHSVLRARDGRETPIEDSAAPILDDDGTLQGVILVFHDVSEKREAQRSLHEAEWRARTALDVGGASSWSIDFGKNRVSGDVMLARVLGIPAEQLADGVSAETFFGAIQEEDRPEIKGALQTAGQAPEVPFAAKFRMQTSDGRLRWIQARGRVESRGDGTPERLFGFLLDVTAAHETESALRESEGRFRLLSAIGDATRTLLDPAEIMATVTRLLGEHLQASRCAYADVAPDGDQFRILHDYVNNCISTVGSYTLSSFGGECAAQIRAGQTLVLRDAEQELPPEDAAMFRTIRVRATVSCPLVKNGGLRAMMAVHQDAPRDWTPEEIALVEEVVERCWATIERARAEAAVREQKRLAELRAEVAAELSCEANTSDTLQRCCALLVEHLDAAFARVWTLNTQTQNLELCASAGLYEHLDGPHSRIRIGEFKIGRIAQSQMPHLTNDVSHDPNISSPDWAAREGMQAFAGYPLVAEGTVLGVVAMFARKPFSQAVITDLAPIAQALAQCLIRKRAQAALQSSEALKATILNTALDGFILIDHTGHIVDWNTACETIFGQGRDEAVGRLLGDVIVPERLREAHTRGLARYVESRQGRILGQRLELPAIRADGSEFPCEVSIACIPGTEPPLFAGSLRDITERKKAELELRAAKEQAESAARAVAEAAERFRILSEVVALQVWTARPDGSLDFSNHECLKYFGVDNEHAILGNSWANFVHPDDLGLASGAWHKALETGESYETEFRLRSASGEYRWFLVRAEPMCDGAGCVVQWFGTNTDIHTLKNAQRDAEQASRAKDDFLAALSHELRTPLTPVLMSAAALRGDDRLPADARELLGMMERNIALEARLIDDLLDLTRIAKGKLPLRPQRCDAHSLIGLAMEIVRDDAQAKNITLNRDFSAEHSGLMADPARFQQVIWNLLRNAVKFTPPGGRISIRTYETGNRQDRRLRIEVSDSGIGISPVALQQIFLPFEQGGLTGDHRFGGMGLGLAIARAIVDLHGGTIHAESGGENCGATFVVELPGAMQPPHGINEPPAGEQLFFPAGAGTSFQQPTASLNSMRLLLVEDHEPTLQVLSRLLRRVGHTVVTAGNVQQALAAAEAGEFDGVISDLGLPDGTGTELMKTLRARHHLRGIALSGYGMEEDLARSKLAGFAVHLIKPVDFHQLQRALVELVESPIG